MLAIDILALFLMQTRHSKYFDNTDHRFLLQLVLILNNTILLKFSQHCGACCGCSWPPYLVHIHDYVSASVHAAPAPVSIPGSAPPPPLTPRLWPMMIPWQLVLTPCRSYSWTSSHSHSVKMSVITLLLGLHLNSCLPNSDI